MRADEAPEAVLPMAEVASRLPNGLAAAAIVAAGTGCFAIGDLAVLGNAFRPVAKFLTFYRPTGPLSGVSTAAILLWLATWIVLARRWRSKDVNIARANAVALALLLGGVLLTFPPFADLLIGK